MRLRMFGKTVFGVVLAAGWLFGATSAAASSFTFTRTSFGTGNAQCFSSVRGFSQGLTYVVPGQESFSTGFLLCSHDSYYGDSYFGAYADVDPTSAPFPTMGAGAWDWNGNGAGVSAFIVEGVTFAGGDPTATTLFTWRIRGSFSGLGDNGIAFQVYNDRSGPLAHLDLTQIDGSSIYYILKDAAHPSGVSGTTGLSFDFPVSFNLGPSDVGFLVELFAGAYLLEGTSTSANAYETVTLVDVIPPPGGIVTLASGQTFGGTTDTIPPTTTATPSPAPNANGWNNTDVTVTLNAVDDPGGTGVSRIEFSLSGAQSGGGSASGSTASVTIGTEGTTTLTYFARDNAGNVESPKRLTIHLDRTPPAIAGLPAPGCTLWPPNHRLVQVATVAAVDGLSGLAPGSVAVTVGSNEPENGLGDGDMAPDTVISGGSIQLRAERSGTGSGRVYTLAATASDLAGNAAIATTTCVAPHRAP